MQSSAPTDRLAAVVIGLVGGGIAVSLAIALPRLIGAENEIGATAASVDAAAFALAGLGFGLLVATFLASFAAKQSSLHAAVTSGAVAFAVVLFALFLAPLDTDRLSRIFDVPFVAIALAPFAAVGGAVGVSLRTGLHHR